MLKIMSNLVELIQPKEYTSKIKLYTNKCQFNVKRVGSVIENPYICRVIKIEEI